MSGSETVKVMVRARPLNPKELDRGCQAIALVNEAEKTVTLSKPKEKDVEKQFTFDAVFAPQALQSSIYEKCGFPIIEAVIEGYNGTILAYGQTGCGKTFTMMGPAAGAADHQKFKGIIPRAFDHIFSVISSTKSKKNFLVRCSYTEIYNEEVRDLLGKDPKAKLDLKESPEKGIFIKDVTMNVVKSIKDLENLMYQGSANRSVGETQMNQESSRSHSIFTIYVEVSEEQEGKIDPRITAGKLNLVDLAGSERQSKTGATGDRMKEAQKINLSLTALGNVISALVDGNSQHVPYRDSKLTRLLQDSLGGNTKTVMIATISPADYNFDESMSTLRYASRAKMIKNKPKINEDPKDAVLRDYAEEIKRLKALLAANANGTGMLLLNQANQGNLGNQQVQTNSTSTNAAGGAVSGKNPNKKQGKQQAKGGENYEDDDDYDQNNGGKVNPNHPAKEKMEEELRDREEVLWIERQKREHLENLIKTMKDRMLVAGQDDLFNDPEQKKKYEELHNKLKEEQEKQAKLLEEKSKKDEIHQQKENQYKNLQEEVDEQRTILKSLATQYKTACSEIQDRLREQEAEKEDLLETIRQNEKNFKFMKEMVRMLLTDDEIAKMRSKTTFDENGEVRLPQFVLKERKVKLPKLGVVQEKEGDSDMENEKGEFPYNPNDDDEDEGKSPYYVNKGGKPDKYLQKTDNNYNMGPTPKTWINNFKTANSIGPTSKYYNEPASKANPKNVQLAPLDNAPNVNMKSNLLPSIRDARDVEASPDKMKGKLKPISKNVEVNIKATVRYEELK